MKKIILFDIDYVLIDSSRLKEISSIAAAGILNLGLTEMEQLNDEFGKTLESTIEFSPERLVQFLTNYYPQSDKKALLEVYRDPQLYQQSTFTDVFPALEKLKQDNLLGIYSEGIKEFQMAKLTFSGIESFFDRNLIFIYPDKTGKAGELVKKLGEIYFDSPHTTESDSATKNQTSLPWQGTAPACSAVVYFVDDNPKHIKDVAATPGAHPIWLKRGPKAQTQETLNCPTILSLSGLCISKLQLAQT